MLKRISKIIKCGAGSKKLQGFVFFFRMCLSLYDYQNKTNRCSNGLTYFKITVTTNQKQTTESQKIKIREFKHNRKPSNHKRKNNNKMRGTKKYKINWKAMFKMAINTCQ